MLNTVILPGNAQTERPKQLFDEIGHVWALEGANLEHKWIQKVKAYFEEQETEEEQEEEENEAEKKEEVPKEQDAASSVTKAIQN